MKIISATDARTNFGKYMSVAMVEPVTINRSGHETIVMLSKNEYDRLEACEDYYWGMRAQEAEENGEWTSVEEGEKIIENLKDLLNLKNV